ncbi:MAG: sensor histidine kinase, partial [Geminicoccaceae bacterium]
PFTAYVDESQIQQVLTNIIVNATQAQTDGGQIDIRLENVNENQFVQIEIKDDGPGMDRETLNHVFEPFYTTKDVGEGTGLGMSIAYGIITEHGGQISVESQPGSGTIFRILLPKSELASQPIH